ncbi:MAG: hypothetical protein ACLFUS_12975 [Candidatus Sumerlaeia bacterium]
MPLTEKQQKRVEGIIGKLNDYLDKRFSQARRVNDKVGAVEADIRWHQLTTVRQVIESAKSFGPVKLFVADILASADEEKKRMLFNPVDQVSMQNEIIPSEDERADSARRAGQLEIRDVSSYYRSLDPSLEKIIRLMQTWIWWDLRDAADLYRFDVQEQRLMGLKDRDLDEATIEHYRKEIGARPGLELSKNDIIKHEMDRTEEILHYFQIRRNEEHGYQMIVVSEEREGNPEADALCIRLAKRLTAMDKIRNQGDNLDDSVKKFYAGQLSISPDQLTGEKALEFEGHMAARDRQRLAEQLSTDYSLGQTINYKATQLEKLKKRLAKLKKAIGMNAPKQEAESEEVEL